MSSFSYAQNRAIRFVARVPKQVLRSDITTRRARAPARSSRLVGRVQGWLFVAVTLTLLSGGLPAAVRAQDAPPPQPTPQPAPAQGPVLASWSCPLNASGLAALSADYARGERRDLELRQADGRYSLRLPLVGMLGGLLGAAIAAPGASSGPSTGDAFARVGAITLLAVGIASTFWLGYRVHERRPIKRELTALRGQQAYLKQELAIGSACLHAQQAAGQGGPAYDPDFSTPKRSPVRAEAAARASVQRKYGIDLPIVTITVGYAGGLILGGAALFTWWFYSPSYEFDLGPTQRERRITRTLGVSASLFAAGGTAGVVWLVSRLRARREALPHAGHASVTPYLSRDAVGVATTLRF